MAPYTDYAAGYGRRGQGRGGGARALQCEATDLPDTLRLLLFLRSAAVLSLRAPLFIFSLLPFVLNVSRSSLSLLFIV